MRDDFGRRALRDDPPAMHAGARPEVHDMVGLPDRILVMLDDDHGIAEIAQVDERVEQSLIVALVQADGRFIEDVHHADQPRADLARQPDTLRLAAGQRVGAAIQREIAQAHVAEEAEPSADLLDDLDGDFAAPAREGELGEELDGAIDRQRRHLGDAAAVDEDVAGRPVEARPGAFGAGARGAILRQFFAHRGRFGFLVAAFEVLDDALEGVAAFDRAAFAIEILELDLLVGAAEQHQVLDGVRQTLERRLDVELRVPRQRLDQLKVVGVAPVPAAHRAPRQRQMRIGDDLVGVEEFLRAEAVAGRTRADRTVEGEQPGFELAQGVVANGAGELVGENQFGPAGIVHERDARHALTEPQRGFEGFGETLAQVRPDLEAIDDGLDGVLAAHIELFCLVQFHDLAVDARPHEAARLQFVEQFGVLALAFRNGRREQHHRGALRLLEDGVDHLAHGLCGEIELVIGAARRAGAGVQEPQIVVDNVQLPLPSVGGASCTYLRWHRTPEEPSCISPVRSSKWLPRVRFARV